MPQSQSVQPRLALIVAAARNGVIGRDNQLPWRLPGELQYFKARTWGKPVIMGRKTHESIGRILPGRLNIVVSRNAKPRPEPGLCWASSLESALTIAQARCPQAEEIMVMGGETVYRQALELADRVYLTSVDTDVDGDAWFPRLDPDQWQLTQDEAGSSKALLPYRFQCYDRVKPQLHRA